MRQNNLQQPIHSGFAAQSTAQDVIRGIDLSGKIAIVTGGSAGIGLETTKTLASAGATVIVPARDLEKAKKNLSGIENVEIEKMDLIDPNSIDSFAEKFISTGRKLDLLINNAGIMWVPLRRDSRGIESQLATNYLGQFHLTAKLWEALKKADGARVINVSSYGHQMSPFDFEDPNFENREYQTLIGYGQSKTASNLFAVALDEKARKFNVRAYSLHPGSVFGTDLGREEPIDLFIQIGTHDENGKIKPEVEAQLKTIPQGAATTVWCATSPLLENIGGVYCENCDIAEIDNGQIEHRFDDPPTIRGVQPYSIDKENAERLWKLSEEILRMKFDVE
ncbi:MULTISPECIES: SDR family NAD(P)-dependent oxidoreductase [Chryseobacterium]|uniref:NAD(P)-dependent dehydrogenase (Short-subunit alcohol dehydrogenase family) n=1 Tax=Chryseobacterium geocarposphaerae TaxID=1416776 RepID=A0ABU1L9Y1_9FLAO|nr:MULTISPECIES: SDR family NAD(P)-dependent oxidoreductase [Chryseobacterium]MDR6403521.1 NAD(P)-dependent dehydrogenase (short-subunit alcohol dehydrogenase family) [Chryseobacterium geocarposphaerae]MDR6697075.1 NAD(P)-dependent dehydrogenase (short-subunit alcohol dehydrogenase family) [Chryseobacterium ginsenosidimutans]